MLKKKLIPIIFFNILYMLISIPLALAKDNSEFLFYIFFMFIFIAIVAFIHFRVKLTIPLLWCFSLWGFSHMAGGLIDVPESWPTNNSSVLYSLWLIPGYLKYDNIIHAFGFGTTTWACWQCLISMAKDNKATTGKLTLAAAAGLGFGAINEILEFAATLLIPETNVGGYYNTGWDLVANLIGALTAVILIRYNCKNRTVALN